MAGVDVLNHQKCPHFHKGCSLFGARTKMIAIIFSLNFHILEKVESTVGGGGFQHLLRHSYVDCLFVFLSFLYCLFVFLRIVFVFCLQVVVDSNTILRHSYVDWLFRSKRGEPSEASNCFNYSFLWEWCISAHNRDGKGNCFNYSFRSSELSALQGWKKSFRFCRNYCVMIFGYN